MGGPSPRFRRDMQATNVEDDGMLFVEVIDPRSGKSFRFYDFEHTVALAFDGRPLDVVAADLREVTQLELTQDQLASFADQLQALGFLENGENAPAAGKTGASATDSAATKTEDSGFFPPLTAEETGLFDRPRILEEVEAAVAAQDEAVTPSPEPLPTPAPEPMPPPHPPIEPMVPSPLARSAASTALAPPPRSTNGAHPAGHTQSEASGPSVDPAPSVFPRGKTPTPQPASPSPPVEAAPRDTEEPADLPATNPGRAESLRLVPTAPFPLATESEPEKVELVSEHAPELEPDLDPDPEPDPEPVSEPIEEQPIVLGTGSPSFPSPVPAEEPGDAPADEPGEEPGEAAPRQLELSMTRRFITPKRDTPAVTPRPVWLAYAALGVCAAIIVAVMVYRYFSTDEPAPVSVRVVVPSPGSVYRWWDATAPVQQSGGAPLTLPIAGRVAEIIPAGSRFAAGDVLAMLESAKPFRAAVSHNKSRLAYYEQMRETMIQQENRAKLREAELKIAEKKRLITEAEKSFTSHALIAAQPGEVAEALVSRGATVKVGDPVLRLKSSGYRATFELNRGDAEKARQLGFCRAEIAGKPIECSLATEGGDETHVAIELPNDPNLTGKAVRLARDRLDAVFSVPVSALVRVGETDRLFVVAPSTCGNLTKTGQDPLVPCRAEMRVVAVADRGPSGATITQGLDVGDRVIVDAPQALRADTRVLINGTTSR